MVKSLAMLLKDGDLFGEEFDKSAKQQAARTGPRDHIDVLLEQSKTFKLGN